MTPRYCAKNNRLMKEHTQILLFNDSDLNALVNFCNSSIDRIESATNASLLAEIEAIKNTSVKIRRLEPLLRGAIAHELSKDMRQSGGAGKRDETQSGCMATYAKVAKMFGYSSKHIEVDARIYREFFVRPQSGIDDEKTLRETRNVWLRRLLSFKREFFLAALASSDPLAAIETAEKRFLANSNYSVAEFKRDLNVVTTASDAAPEVAHREQDAHVRNITFKLNLTYDDYERLELLAQHRNVAREQIVRDAIDFYFKNMNTEDLFNSGMEID